jgi:hypothetical protein
MKLVIPKVGTGRCQSAVVGIFRAPVFRLAVAALAVVVALARASEARAGIITVDTSSSTITITEMGKLPAASSGAVPEFPGVFSFGAGIPAAGGGFSTEGFGAISYAFSPPPSNTFVFIPTSPPAFSPSYVSQASVAGMVTSTTEIDFSVTFLTDASGLAPASLPSLMYPMFSIIGPGQSASFSASIAYAIEGAPVGTQTLLYTAPLGVGFGTATGTPLDLPMVPGDDTLTVSGSFVFTLSRLDDGPPSEIKTFGAVPEPSSLALLTTGASLIGSWAVFRRIRSRREILGDGDMVS